jgi:NAD(P)-dependent dehydrogenase (short-subunit alcohol dehydrogenase family)
MIEFHGKVALIAGGGSGIGEATAELLASRGATVAVADLNGGSADRVAARIVASGGSATGHAFDIADERSVAEMFESVRAQHHQLHLLVNVAADLSPGTLGSDASSDVSNIPLEAWDRTLDVGLRGFVLTLRQALPMMVEVGGGAVVNVSSLAAFLGEPVRVAYATTKTGVNALTRHVASAFGKKNIRCNSVTPGFTLTPSAKGSFTDEQLASMARHNPMRRLGAPSDIANAIAFLLSDEASWINGQVIAVDGGTTMRQ